MDRLGMIVVASLGMAVLMAGAAGWKYLADSPSAGQRVAMLAEHLQLPPSRSSSPRKDAAPPDAGATPPTSPRRADIAGELPADATSSTYPPHAAKHDGGKAGLRTSQPAEAPRLPVLELAQVDEDGHVVLAGRAQPGADIVVLVDGAIIGRARVDEHGAWTFNTDGEPPLHDLHRLTVRSEGSADGVPARSLQAITVNMRPVRAGGKPVVVLATTSGLDTVDTAPQQHGLAARLVPSDTEAPRRAATDELAQAVQQWRRKQHSQTDDNAGDRTTATRTTEGLASATAIAAGAARHQAPLTLQVVDYDASGAVIFSGHGPGAATLRLFVNNHHLADVQADKTGSWQWRGHGDIPPGQHVLRIERLAADGRVLERVELPFVRANRRQIAKMRAVARRMQQPQRELSANTAIPETEMKISSVHDAATAGMHAAADDEGSLSVTRKGAAGPSIVAETAADDASSGHMQTRRDIERFRTRQTMAPVAATDEIGRSARPMAGNGFIVVQPGNTLWNIARVIYGKGVRYTTIYENNRERIRNPHRIYPGQIFAAPGIPARQISIDPRRRRPATKEELEQSTVLLH